MNRIQLKSHKLDANPQAHTHTFEIHVYERFFSWGFLQRIKPGTRIFIYEALALLPAACINTANPWQPIDRIELVAIFDATVNRIENGGWEEEAHIRFARKQSMPVHTMNFHTLFIMEIDADMKGLWRFLCCFSVLSSQKRFKLKKKSSCRRNIRCVIQLSRSALYSPSFMSRSLSISLIVRFAGPVLLMKWCAHALCARCLATILLFTESCSGKHIN